MSDTLFIIPGFNGSGPAHWQSWTEARLPGAARLHGVNWARPDLNHWVDQAQAQVLQLRRPMWLLAHSFGCLVAATLAAVAPELIAGAVFVAPAEPRRFARDGGLRDTRLDHTPQAIPSLLDLIPHALPPSVQSVLLASENDPWLDFFEAEAMAQGWRSHFVNLGEVGHVNTDSGYGPWPGLLQQLERLTQKGRIDPRDWTARRLTQNQRNLPAQPPREVRHVTINDTIHTTTYTAIPTTISTTISTTAHQRYCA
ncbi:MAG: alpha/beta hydrolase [Pseudomonadales bacterium]|nr:alpha/beta hydrolase [Pseudomonadales bacterium]